MPRPSGLRETALTLRAVHHALLVLAIRRKVMR
jgi:hypothetical protein